MESNRATEVSTRETDGKTDVFTWDVGFSKPAGLIRLEIASKDVKKLVLQTHSVLRHVSVVCSSPWRKHVEDAWSEEGGVNQTVPFCHDAHRDITTRNLYPSGGNRLLVVFTDGYPPAGDTVTLTVPAGFDLEVDAPHVLDIENDLTHPNRLSVRQAKWTTFAGFSGSCDRNGVSWEYTEFGSRHNGHPSTVITAPKARTHLHVPENLLPLVQSEANPMAAALIRHMMDSAS